MAVKMGPSRECVRCGEPFMQGRLGRKALYCSRSCRSRAYEERRALGLLAPLLGAAEGYAARPSGERRNVTDEETDNSEAS
jgi:hypothetical protein